MVNSGRHLSICRLGLCVMVLLAIFSGCTRVTGGFAPSQSDLSSSPRSSASFESSTPTPKVQKLLPRGQGAAVFPQFQLFGYSGSPKATGQGRLGIGNLDERVVEMEQRSAPFLANRAVLPVLELIATTVHAFPGPDGLYRERESDAVIGEYLAAARRRNGILLLNIQPGQAKFIDELKFYEKWLVEPDVGVALDPEWAVGPGQVPGQVYGRTTGVELNECAAYLSNLATQQLLPEKIMVYHQLSVDLVQNEEVLVPHRSVVLVKSVDGIGSPAAKANTYRAIASRTPKFVHLGFKLFYEEDIQRGGRLMEASEVLSLVPQPEYVLFE